MNGVDLGSLAFGWLVAVGAVSGAASWLAFQHWCDTEKLRVASNGMLAHLMEFRLFTDEPALILRAQRDLLRANARLLRLTMGPSLLLTIPFTLLLVAADGYFARASLRLGEATVVTVQSAGAFPNMTLQTPAGINVETPPVWVRSQNQVSWRVRPIRAASGNLQLRWSAGVIEKSISAAPGLHWISEQRSGSWLSSLVHPREFPFSNQPIEWIRIQYPRAVVFGVHWLVWFSAAVCLGAVAATFGASRI